MLLPEPSRSARIPFTPHQLAEIGAMYEAGYSSVKISERYGICCEAVLLRVRQLGVPVRGSGMRTIQFDAAQLARMAAMYEGGASTHEIAKVYGISSFTVRARLRRLGVEIRGNCVQQMGEK